MRLRQKLQREKPRKAAPPGNLALDERGHVPERMCAGCGGRFARKTLVRFTVTGGKGNAGLVAVDAGGKAGGRGAYVCRRLECFDAATGKRRSLQRRLKAEKLEPGTREVFISLTQEQ